MHILITGATGFIGQRLIEHLGNGHDITVMSRSAIEGIGRIKVRQIIGSFDQPDTLRKLDSIPVVDAVIHLAAVTGGSDEEEALAVNVAGTRRLYRYLLDHGCRKFITASSIAAAGVLDPAFTPLELPIQDDHPCLATDAYGLSKAMVEELTRYFHRTSPDTDFINVRLGAVVPDESFEQPKIDTETELSVPYVELGRVYASDVVDAFVRMLEAPFQVRCITCNLVAPDSGAAIPTIELLWSWYGVQTNRDKLKGYMGKENTYKPLYAINRLESEFGIIPKKRLRPLIDSAME
ncbi:NAD-dependent epimerase/dehydratase family protein [Paenibacillus radicis (ex Gao et al. 2016)]|uniref:NAD-dependent epimerase/dehydratase domain-containing protein n=1 Tax=Paenibacillus radicis (ex Gao et al. 2016) TaxID=1737354 RepID=A0A917GX08_9BACL|nr:NAD(P)-dependent oxidoreductase [Paenibacillus radicis (ex Gao et al. 2016)]GGG59692.1 hypothetical protein GCM10010918_11080 [Paenibacillus radicis (ex Gao et al. 2016)]